MCVKEARDEKDKVLGSGERERFEDLWLLLAVTILSTTSASRQVTLQAKSLASFHPSIMPPLQSAWSLRIPTVPGAAGEGGLLVF